MSRLRLYLVLFALVVLAGQLPGCPWEVIDARLPDAIAANVGGTDVNIHAAYFEPERVMALEGADSLWLTLGTGQDVFTYSDAPMVATLVPQVTNQEYLQGDVGLAIEPNGDMHLVYGYQRILTNGQTQTLDRQYHVDYCWQANGVWQDRINIYTSQDFADIGHDELRFTTVPCPSVDIAVTTSGVVHVAIQVQWQVLEGPEDDYSAVYWKHEVLYWNNLTGLETLSQGLKRGVYFTSPSLAVDANGLPAVTYYLYELISHGDGNAFFHYPGNNSWSTPDVFAGARRGLALGNDATGQGFYAAWIDAENKCYLSHLAAQSAWTHSVFPEFAAHNKTVEGVDVDKLGIPRVVICDKVGTDEMTYLINIDTVNNITGVQDVEPDHSYVRDFFYNPANGDGWILSGDILHKK